MTSAYNRWCQQLFYVQPTLKRLFNNCIKLYWYQISSSWNMKRESNWPPPLQKKKTTLKKPSLIRVKINLSFLIKLFFYITKKVRTNTGKSLEQKELLRRNKKHFHHFKKKLSQTWVWIFENVVLPCVFFLAMYIPRGISIPAIKIKLQIVSV